MDLLNYGGNADLTGSFKVSRVNQVHGMVTACTRKVHVSSTRLRSPTQESSRVLPCGWNADVKQMALLLFLPILLHLNLLFNPIPRSQKQFWEGAISLDFSEETKRLNHWFHLHKGNWAEEPKRKRLGRGEAQGQIRSVGLQSPNDQLEVFLFCSAGLFLSHWLPRVKIIMSIPQARRQWSSNLRDGDSGAHRDFLGGDVSTFSGNQFPNLSFQTPVPYVLLGLFCPSTPSFTTTTLTCPKSDHRAHG